MNITWRDEPLQLRPERAVYLPARGALLVADVHVGKAEAFQRRGVPVPSGVGDADLGRLSSLLDACGARSLWVLGDLVHDRDALDTDGLDRLRARHVGVDFHVVRGNHDRHLEELPPAWGFEVHASTAALGPFALRHEPEGSDGDLYTLCGHLHPMTKLRGAGDFFGTRQSGLPDLKNSSVRDRAGAISKHSSPLPVAGVKRWIMRCCTARRDWARPRWPMLSLTRWAPISA